MAGRPRKPSAVKKNQGTFQQSRNPENELQMTPLDKMPPAPKGFGKHSLRLWKLGEELIKQSVLTEPDLVNFELFCIVYGRVMAFNEHIQKNPLKNVEGKQGGRSAQAQQMNADMGLLLKLSNEFGLTPASRNKFGITKKKEEDPNIKKMRGLIGE